MTRHPTLREPGSGFASFLLLAGFLIAGLALALGVFSALLVPEALAGNAGAQTLVAQFSAFVVPLAFMGVMLGLVAMVLESRRDARAAYDTATESLDTMDELVESVDERPVYVMDRDDMRRVPVRAPGEPAPRARSIPVVRAERERPPTQRAPPTSSVAGAAGHPGARDDEPGPPPGPEPGEHDHVPWHAQRRADRNAPSAKPEPWRHSRTQIRSR